MREPASVAFVHDRARGPSRCGEFEGTEDECRDAIARYKMFLARFPMSRFAVQAQDAMKEAAQELEKFKKR